MLLAPGTPPIHVTKDDDDLVEDENHDGEEDDGEEDDGEEDDGEEDADISIFAEADENGEDYNVYGKVEDEDEEDDDMCFEDFKKIKGGRSNGNNIYVNQSFVSKDALLSELRLTAVRLRFSFRIYKSTKTLLVTTCPVSSCEWKIRANVKYGTNTFWVTKLFIDRVGIIDGLNQQHITHAMKNMFGMKLDYTTSYIALLYAQTLVRGSAEDGYSRLPSYLEQISLANPDFITAIELDSINRIKCLFLSFGASIKGFKYQRRVIVVDETHLSGKYGDAEDEPSWEWFFTKLASCVSDEQPLVIVFDRHTAIKSACDKVFPWATRGICYYHLQDNIVKKYKGKHLLYLVKGAAYAHTVLDFDQYMAEIRSANPTLQRIWRMPTSAYGQGFIRARGFSIQFMLEFIREKLGNWFLKRREDALSLPTQHSWGVEYLLAVRSEIADTMTVQPIDGWRFFVKGGKMDSVVDLEHGKCDCGVYAMEKIPCSHAIAAGTSASLHISTLVYPVYSKGFSV
ncbi:uncharacterized protein LOC103849422 [Brassica rapa]|uniref:uncharacterized protein LOC103849422 n=1 Tax=Brassica campestris TaxID=3711 RepID=UPI00142E734D|nr:uncharacterized protein LOC103849422 [Brassica rapa]